MLREQEEIERVGHREFVGGYWPELGQLQLQFLVDHGLRPHHVLLDIGCGALRGGVHFIAYLDRGRYLGIDKHEALIQAGLTIELDAVLRARRAPDFVVSDAFEFDRFSKRPNYALAQSLFTHLDQDDIRRCLRRLRAFAEPGCRFFATYFEASEPAENPAQSSSLLRFDYADEELLALGESEGWNGIALGDWGHPRGQRMMLFEAPEAPTRRPAAAAPVGCVSVAIPVKDGGAAFKRCLDALGSQDGVHIAETIVVDSGSRDGTQDIARRAGARVVEISPEEFNHGATRNLLGELASCDTVLFTVHDAVFLRPDAVRLLVEQLAADPSLAAVSGRTRPGPGADLYSEWDAWLHDELVVAPRLSPLRHSDLDAPVDNVCAAIRRRAWEEVRFRDLDFGEDADFAGRATAAGWHTAFSAEVLVAHHHDRDAAYAMSRAAIDRLTLAGLLGGEVSVDTSIGPSALGAGCRGLLRELATATEWAIAGEEWVRLRAFLERLAGMVRAGVPMSDPHGELALVDELLEVSPIGDCRGTAAARAQLTQVLDFPLLRTYAGRSDGGVGADAARTFAGRLAADKLGHALGESLRHEEAPDLRERLGQAYGARGYSGDASKLRSPERRRAAAPQVFAVLGMHRSGTSVAAGVVNLLGVPFGEEGTMLPPQPDNPRGYREQRPILDLNDELLEVLGRAWNDPTALPDGWESTPELQPLEERARRIVHDLYGDLDVWGFKDPRLSILIPFWLRLLPNMRFVVCVRNPIDVVSSLEARDGAMGDAAVDLWLEHTAAALLHTAGRPRLIVAYEDLIGHLDDEVDRLAAFIGLGRASITSGVREQIGGLVDAELWRHRSSLADVLSDARLPSEAKVLYLWLQEATGRFTPNELGSGSALPALREDLAAGLAKTRSDLAGRNRDVQRLAAQLTGREAELAQLRSELADTGSEVAELRNALADARRRLKKVRRALEHRKTRLRELQGSRSWRMTAPFRRAKRMAWTWREERR